MNHKLPVILDTDIGSDIDDTWALAFLLRCPELDVRLVTACTDDTVFRARLIARLLQDAGRHDVPVGVGPRTSQGGANQGAYIEGYDLSDYPGVVHADGVGAIVDVIMSSPTPVTLIAIGPNTNVAAALRREPAIAERCRYVGMGGSLTMGTHRAPGPVAEYNVCRDVAATRAVLAAPWDVSLTPLDSCGDVCIRGDKYAALARSGDPLAKTCMHNYEIWNPSHPVGRTTVLFDAVAVYMAFATDLLEMRDLPLTVDDAGFTRVDAAGRTVHVAAAMREPDTFEDLFLTRLGVSTTR